MRFLPEQPFFARSFGEKVLALKSLGYGEPFRAFANQHHVAGMQSHGVSQQRSIFYIANSSHRSCCSCGTMHAASVEFDHAFFVGMSAQTDTLVIRIILWALHHSKRSIESVTTPGQECICLVEVVIAIGCANNNRQLGRMLCGVLVPRGFLGAST